LPDDWVVINVAQSRILSAGELIMEVPPKYSFTRLLQQPVSNIIRESSTGNNKNGSTKNGEKERNFVAEVAKQMGK